MLVRSWLQRVAVGAVMHKAQEALNRLTVRQLPFAEHILGMLEQGHRVASTNSTVYVVVGVYFHVFLDKDKALKFADSYGADFHEVTIE